MNPPPLPAFGALGGIRLAAVDANVRGYGRPDLVLIELPAGTSGAGVFTRSAFRAAPVIVAQEALALAAPRALLINAGNANAATGEPGVADARACCAAVGAALGVDPVRVLPFSTGVIGERLPVHRITGAVPDLVEALSEDAWSACARAIMTTDTVPKGAVAEARLGDGTVRIAGFAKGSGMIRPDMATLLAFVFTDAVVDQALLRELLREGADGSFNRITVDGDTSTNDALALFATGTSGVAVGLEDRGAFAEALQRVLLPLAQAVVRDGEGATKFVEVRVSGGRDPSECLRVAYAVAESPLVKTAFAASDANWGRLFMAVGKAGVSDLAPSDVSIRLGDVPVLERGGLADGYTEPRGAAVMARDEIRVGIDLGRGDAAESVWTTDLSHDYVRINAEYRS